jgi:hypothetical protein
MAMPMENHPFEPQFYSKILPIVVCKIYIFPAIGKISINEFLANF